MEVYCQEISIAQSLDIPSIDSVRSLTAIVYLWRDLHQPITLTKGRREEITISLHSPIVKTLQMFFSDVMFEKERANDESTSHFRGNKNLYRAS